MIRTLIFGAIAGYVGKKLYDEGKLTEFKNDLTKRVDTLKSEYGQSGQGSVKPASAGSASAPAGVAATH